MKIERIACDLCADDEADDAVIQIRFKDFRSPVTRGRPENADLLDLCAEHYRALALWISDIRESTQ